MALQRVPNDHSAQTASFILYKEREILTHEVYFYVRVITKLPNSENQSTTENWENRNDPDLVQAFLKKLWVESDLSLIHAAQQTDAPF